MGRRSAAVKSIDARLDLKSAPPASARSAVRSSGTADPARLTTAGYRLLAAFRYELRKFTAFSEQAARGAGIEPQQHQLLLALRGLPPGVRPTVGMLAERLCVQPHTAVALVDKLEERDLLRRERGTGDRREVLLRITTGGDAILRKLSSLHREQLASAGPSMVEALEALLSGRAPAESGEVVLGPLVDSRVNPIPLPRASFRATKREKPKSKG